MAFRLLNFAIVIASLVLGSIMIVAVGEIILRVRFDVDGTRDLRDMAEYHPVRGWSLKPGSYDYVSLDAFRKSRITINDLGFRGPPVRLRVDENKERITLVGDSFLFAAVLNEPQTIAGLLRQLSAPKEEFVNLSVPGYGTGQQIAMLSELVSKGYEIGNTLVLFFFTNDILDNRGLDYRTGKPIPEFPAFSVGTDGKMVLTRAPVKPKPSHSEEGKASRLLFMQFLETRLEQFAIRFPYLLEIGTKMIDTDSKLRRRPGLITAWYMETWRDRWDLTQLLLRNLIASFSDDGRKNFLIVFIPSPLQISPEIAEFLGGNTRDRQAIKNFLSDVDRPQRALHEFCEKIPRIKCIDPTAKLRSASSESFPYFLQEGHLNERGAEIVVSEVYAAIRSLKDRTIKREAR